MRKQPKADLLAKQQNVLSTVVIFAKQVDLLGQKLTYWANKSTRLQQVDLLGQQIDLLAQQVNFLGKQVSLLAQKGDLLAEQVDMVATNK